MLMQMCIDSLNQSCLAGTSHTCGIRDSSNEFVSLECFRNYIQRMNTISAIREAAETDWKVNHGETAIQLQQ